MTGPTDNWLLYDGECPFCTAYVKMTRFRDAAGPIRLVDARDPGPERAAAETKGYDLDEGMLLHFNGDEYYGKDALHVIATLTTPSGALNRLNAWLYRSPRRAKLAYPVLRAGRNAALRVLGRSKIADSPSASTV